MCCTTLVVSIFEAVRRLSRRSAKIAVAAVGDRLPSQMPCTYQFWLLECIVFAIGSSEVPLLCLWSRSTVAAWCFRAHCEYVSARRCVVQASWCRTAAERCRLRCRLASCASIIARTASSSSTKLGGVTADNSMRMSWKRKPLKDYRAQPSEQALRAEACG